MAKLEVSVATIIGYNRCTRLGIESEALDVFLGYSSPSGFHILQKLIWCSSGGVWASMGCTFSIGDRSAEQAGQGSNSI
ncbi:hypothetical protein TNCV_3522971 [Trichonephila clavipes]|uniref:Uncharacterized protein n=1 Tax=Trichonephila clavipes TaxID=2585209 RepID=A0A8X6W978_TRICX|nr:hypothetical protein TNCV_3522971 [Trichonephila clavipes]